MTTDCLGVHYDIEARTIQLLFEAPIAEDKDGNEAPGAMGIKMSLVDGAEFPPIEEYQAMAEKIARDGMDTGIPIAPGAARLITWEEFQAYDNDDDELENSLDEEDFDEDEDYEDE